MPEPTAHQWQFNRLGGFDQVRLETGADIRHLAELDQKLWATLSCPTSGLEFDARTLALLDADGDGRIRVPEVLGACRWVCRVLKDPDDLLPGNPTVPLAAINPDTDEGRQVLASARTILTNLGRPEALVIDGEDTADTDRIISSARFNGDGVVPPTITDAPALATAISDIMACVGGTPDRGGSDGLTQELVEQFFDAARAWLDWYAEGAADPLQLLPLGEGTLAAAAALAAVQAKLDDYFTRTRLAAYDQTATAALNPSEARYSALAASTLAPDSAELAALPIARILPDRPLPLREGVNPAWAEALAAFREQVVLPLLGPLEVLTEADWRGLRQRFAAHAEWQGRMQGALVNPLGPARVRELVETGVEGEILALIAEDLKLADALASIEQVDRLVHYHADLFRLLNNFVTLRDFYTPGQRAIFQAGTLYLDGRGCNLCIEVADIDAHSATASRANTYLAYCECTRGALTRKIVAAFTVGDAEQLREGRHGVFYDRQGQDWDATVVKVVEQPIGVGEAFWRPYKRVGRMISEQIAKFAGSRDAAVDAGAAKGLTDVGAPVGAPPAPAAPAAPATPFDIARFAGIFAALGLAIGAIGTAFATIFASLMKLPVWQLPLVVFGIILVISAPSMLLAWLKLRARNLGPLLDANGWAINTEARLNIPFGASLTEAAQLPPGSARSLYDPFAERRQPWGWYLAALVLIAALGWLGWRGTLGEWWTYLNHIPAPTQPAPATTPAPE